MCGVVGKNINEAGSGKGSIVLNATAEFCRALGDIPTYGMSGNRDEEVEDLMVNSFFYYSDYYCFMS